MDICDVCNKSDYFLKRIKCKKENRSKKITVFTEYDKIILCDICENKLNFLYKKNKKLIKQRTKKEIIEDIKELRIISNNIDNKSPNVDNKYKKDIINVNNTIQLQNNNIELIKNNMVINNKDLIHKDYSFNIRAPYSCSDKIKELLNNYIKEKGDDACFYFYDGLEGRDIYDKTYKISATFLNGEFSFFKDSKKYGAYINAYNESYYIGYVPKEYEFIKEFIFLGKNKKTSFYVTGGQYKDRDWDDKLYTGTDPYSITIKISYDLDQDYKVKLDELINNNRNYFITNDWFKPIELKKITSNRIIKEKYDTYVIMDFETTGLHAFDDRITEFCLLKYKEDKLIDKYTSLVNPQKIIPKTVMNKTGITNDMVKNELKIDYYLPSIIDFIGDNIVIGHNVSFDFDFLNAELGRTIEPIECQNEIRYIDTLALVKQLCFQSKNYKLETLKKYIGVKEESHRAEGDCIVTQKLYCYCKDLLVNHKNGFDIEIEKEHKKLKKEQKNVIEFAKNECLKYGKELYISSLDYDEGNIFNCCIKRNR